MKYNDYFFQAKRYRQAPQLLMVFLLFMLTGPALWAQAPDLSGCSVFSGTFLECSRSIGANTPTGNWSGVDPDGTFESAAGGTRVVIVDLSCVAIEPGCGTAADLELSLAQSYSEDVTGCSKTIVNEWLVRDICGNVSTDRIIVRHNFENPSSFDNISLPTPPADQTLQCRADISSPGTLIAEEDCIGNIAVLGVDTDNGGSGCAGDPLIITRTWTFEDGCGNEASVSQTITVEDDTKPIFPRPSDMTLATSAGADCPDPASISLTVDKVNPIATGNAAFSFTVHGVNIAGPTVYSDNCSSGSSLELYVWNIINHFDGPATACERKILVIYRVYDACGNFQQRRQIFTIIDDTAPVAPAAPGDLNLQCRSDVPNAGNLTATDNCAGPITATGMDTDNGGSGCAGDPLIITRTWTFDDGCGNSSSVSQTITVEDDTPPTFPKPSDMTLTTSAGADCPTPASISLTADQAKPTAKNNEAFSFTVHGVNIAGPTVYSGTCSSGSDLNLYVWDIIEDFDGPATDCERNIRVIYRVYNACNSFQEQQQTFTIKDDTAPETPVGPADLNLQCRSDVPIAGELSARDNCAEPITATGVDTDNGGSGCAGDPFIITRTWTFDDGCGNSSSVSQTITVEDDTPPTFPRPSDMTLATSAGADCPDPASISLTADQAKPTAKNNEAFSFTVHGVSVAGPTVYSDNCSSGSDLELYVWSIIEDFDGPATACERKISVIYRVYDACGNFEQRRQTFTIVDDTAPVVNAPADLNLQCFADVTKAGELTAMDNCAGPITAIGMDTNNGGSGCLRDPLIITRTWVFDDGCGNSSSVSQTITVEDDTSPVVNCPGIRNESTDPGQCSWTSQAGDLSATFSDNCGIASVQWKITFPGPDGSMITGTGDASGKVLPVGTSTVMYTVTDLCGNEATCTSMVTVEDNELPSIECPVTQQVVLDDNCEAILPDYTSLADVDDNCGVESVMQTPAAGTVVSGVGEISVTLIVIDVNGNTNECDFTVDKLDQTPPTLFCLTKTIFLDPFGEYTLMDTDVLDFNTSFDNCSAITVTGISPDFFSCDDLDETFTVLVEAEDASGNSATCNAAITVDQGTALLPPWEQTTLGTGTGDAIYQPCDNDGEFTLTSDTRLFPMNTDNYQYVYQELCGDITITAKITQFAPNGWQGLYIRNVGGNNAAGLAYRVQGNTTTMPSSLAQAHLRQTDGGNLELSQFNTFVQPYWLRITSTPLWYGGRLVQLYASPNGTNWTLAQSRMVSGLNDCVDVGLMLQSQDFNTTVEAKFAYVSATGTAPMLLQGPNSPTVQQPAMRTAELFPNPATSQVTVIFSQALEMDTPYILRNQLGQVVRQGFFKAGDSTVELDVADLASGWYVVQPSNGTPPLRFVKQ